MVCRVNFESFPKTGACVFFGKRKKEPGLMVLAWQREGLAVAHSQPGRDGRALVTVCGHVAASPENPATLEKAAREFHMARYRVSLLAGSDDYQLLMVEAPGVPPEELKAAVRWRMKDMLDFHVDDATLDVVDIPPDPANPARGHYLYAVAARNEVVRRHIALCEQAGVPLEVIDIPEMASRNIASRVAAPERGVALLSFDERGGLFTVSYQGELYLSRRLEMGLAELAAAEGPRASYFERITLELQRSLDYVERQFNFVNVAQLWLAPMSAAAALREELAANLYLPVTVLDLEQVFDLTRVPSLAEPDTQARFFLPLGATLREEPVAP
jgi:MSHA biogenesis protein MshI